MADGPLRFDLSSLFTGNVLEFRVGGRQVFLVDQGGNATLSGTLTAPVTDLTLSGRIVTASVVPTVGSGGSGISALSVVAGSSNTAGQVAATLTAVAPGVIVGVVAFGGTVLSAPKVVICSLAAPTAGVAAPPSIGADTPTITGFTIRSYGPTTVTTGAYVINYICLF